MTAIYCPLSMTGDKPSECVQYRGGACHHCPVESLRKLNEKLDSIANLLNSAPITDGDTYVAESIERLADAIAAGERP